MVLEEIVNIEDVVDCKIILIERMTTGDDESIHHVIEHSNNKSESQNIKSDCDLNGDNEHIDSFIDLTGADSDVDDACESAKIHDKVKEEEERNNHCKTNDGLTDCTHISKADSFIRSSSEHDSIETYTQMMDNKSKIKSEESQTLGNKCSEACDKNRSSVNDLLQQKYAGVDVIDIGDSDDDSDTESCKDSSLPCSTENSNAVTNERDDSIEILSDSDHQSEKEEEEVMFVNTTKSKNSSEHGTVKQQAVRMFKRRRQESRAAFAKVSSQAKISRSWIKYSIPYNETQRAARLNEEEHRSQKNERYEFNESAHEEQERLFKESAARVKAQGYLQTMHGIQFFSKPADVTSLPSNHWKWSDPYSRLGVPRQCSVEIARRNYKKLCLLYHPDKAKKDSSLQFQAIKEAWETISSTKH